VAILALGAGTVRGDLATGLGNYWPFDEGTGTIAHDVISHQNGTLTNFKFDSTDGWRPGAGPSPVALPRNYSIQFDGVDDYIDLGSYSIPETASISAWVNIHGFTGPTNNNAFYILGSETSNYGTTTSVESDGSVWINDREANGNSDSLHTAPGIVPADNKWHQITFLRDSYSPLATPAPSGSESIYVDGILRAQAFTVWTGNNPAAPGAIGTGSPMLGSLMPPTPAPAYADGLIDDVRVYNRLLTATATTVGQTAGGDISALYATAPLPGDANLDGVVDINDLTIVLTNYGQSGANWLTGDFDGSGTVDINDLTIVLANYNQNGSATGLAAVPEPASLLVAAGGLIGLLAVVWRRKRSG
jgi:hypothetical protein